VFVEAEKRERNVRLLDAEHPEANLFHVNEEFTFSNGTPPDIRLDIVFFVNGVPVLPVETKKATAMDGIAQALDDIRYYHHKGPEFLALNQLHALTHLIHFYYGATWNLSSKALFNWRDDAATAGDFESLCKSFVAPCGAHGVAPLRRATAGRRALPGIRSMILIDITGCRARGRPRTGGIPVLGNPGIS